MLSQAQVNGAIERTRKIAAEVIVLKRATIFALAHGITRNVESVIKYKKKVLCVTAHLNGKYGLKDVYVDVPVVLGARGAERVIELKLSNAERERLS